MPERAAAFKGMLRTLRGIERMRRKDARDHAPHLTLLVADEIAATLRLDDARHLPHAIIQAALRISLKLLVAVQRDLVHVRHDRLRTREHGAVHALEHHLRFGERIAVNRKERIIDVAVPERHERDEPSLDVETLHQHRKIHLHLL